LTGAVLGLLCFVPAASASLDRSKGLDRPAELRLTLAKGTAPAAPAHATVSHSATVAVPVPVQVALTFPNAPDAAFAAIRGPDGEVRYFPVEGGKKELATRVIIVRPGERVHIQLPPPKAR
jgi:hypothetical protein